MEEDLFEILENKFSKIKVNDGKTCKNCLTPTVILDIPQASAYCSNCGICDNNYLAINSSPEWKTGDNNVVNRCNVVVDPHLPKISLIANLSGRVSRSVKQRQTWVNFSNSYRECSLKKVFDLLIECSAKIPETNQAIRDYAKFLLARVLGEPYRARLLSYKVTLRGKSNKIGLIALCLFYGFKKKGICRIEEKEISRRLNVDHKYLNVAKALVLNIIKEEEIDPFKIIEPMGIESYCHDFLKKIGFKITDSFYQKVMEITVKVKEYQFQINSVPSSIASGCLYYTSQKYELHLDVLGKKEMANKIGLSEVTIVKCYKWLVQLEKENKI